MPVSRKPSLTDLKSACKIVSTLLKKSSSSSDTTAIASMQYDQALAVEIGPRSGRPPVRILYRI